MAGRAAGEIDKSHSWLQSLRRISVLLSADTFLLVINFGDVSFESKAARNVDRRSKQRDLTDEKSGLAVGVRHAASNLRVFPGRSRPDVGPGRTECRDVSTT